MYNVDTVIILIIPFMAILIMNIRIAVKVVHFYKERKLLAHIVQCGNSGEHRPILQCKDNGESTLNTSFKTRTSPPSSRSSPNYCKDYTPFTSQMELKDLSKRQRCTNTEPRCSKAQVKVTKMLLLVSSTFLLLNLPRHVVRTYTFIMSIIDTKYHPSDTQIIWQKLFHLLYYLQFAINLFLYSAFGQNFRKALRHLCSRIQYKVYRWKYYFCHFQAPPNTLESTRYEITLRHSKHVTIVDEKCIW